MQISHSCFNLNLPDYYIYNINILQCSPLRGHEGGHCISEISIQLLSPLGIQALILTLTLPPHTHTLLDILPP